MDRLPEPYEERYLVIDDTDEDVSQILTIIREGQPRAARSECESWTGGAS
jgi:hypothetical protein